MDRNEELVIAVRFRGWGTVSDYQEKLRQAMWEAAQNILRETGWAACADLVISAQQEIADG